VTRRLYCYGYVRDISWESAEEQIQRLTLKHERKYSKYPWAGFFRDDTKQWYVVKNNKGKILKRQRLVEFCKREAGEQLLAETRKGDIVLATRLGVVFHDAADASENMASFTHRGVRLIFTEDKVELTTEGANLLWAVQRSWDRHDKFSHVPTAAPRYSTPPFGTRRDKDGRLRPLEIELKFMRWCYLRVVVDQLQHKSIPYVVQQLNIVNPRTAELATPNAVISVAEAYHQYKAEVFLALRDSEKHRPTPWVWDAFRMGYFNEAVEPHFAWGLYSRFVTNMPRELKQK
jgi:hypothetical protein